MMTASRRPRILIQTTIPNIADDWNVARFSLLRAELATVADVVARNRENGVDGNDPVLATIDEGDVDQLWLFAVDTGDGITPDEGRAIARYRERGGALFVARDHMDLGCSVCCLGDVGAANYFHSMHPDPNAEHRVNDDTITTYIQWPNFYSGPNGDVQRIAVVAPAHPVFARPGGGTIDTLPAHPHEGAVDAPAGSPDARVVATGRSRQTGRPFNIAVAFDGTGTTGRSWTESTFHHFADYNWSIAAGCPSFVSEPPSDAIAKNPRLLDDTRAYVRNIAAWLGTRAARNERLGLRREETSADIRDEAAR